MLMQPAEWRQEKLGNGDIDPILRVKSRMVDLDGHTFQTNPKNWRWHGPNGISYTSTKEPCTMYGNLRMVRMNIYELLCQDLLFLEYYTAFMIEFLVDIQDV